MLSSGALVKWTQKNFSNVKPKLDRPSRSFQVWRWEKPTDAGRRLGGRQPSCSTRLTQRLSKRELFCKKPLGNLVKSVVGRPFWRKFVGDVLKEGKVISRGSFVRSVSTENSVRETFSNG